MSRPFCWRHIGGRPVSTVFKPAGIQWREIAEVVMTLDEFEALRLADLDGLYQEQAAQEMQVSRPTFSRIVDSARRKVADALVHGKALRIEGGPVHQGRPRCCRRHDAEDDGTPLALQAEPRVRNGRAGATETAGDLPSAKQSGETTMRICIPVLEDQGLESRLSPHFGSTPLFLIVDSVSRSCTAIPNHNLHHSHGHCAPLEALRGVEFDSLVVGGIGRGAAGKLRAAGVRVLWSDHRTVGEVITAFQAGTLRPLAPEAECAGHGHGAP